MSADYSAIPVEVMDELDRYAASLGAPHQTGALLLLAAEARHLRVAGNQIGSVTDPGQDPAETLAVGMAELQRATAVVVSNGMYDIAINALKSAEQAKALPLDAFSLYEKLVRAPIDEAVAEAEQIAREAVDAPLPAPPERA